MAALIQEAYGVHSGGTKFYRIVWVRSPDNRGAVLFQYGKIGLLGAVDFKGFPSSDEAWRFALTKMAQKQSRGYDFGELFITRATQGGALWDGELGEIKSLGGSKFTDWWDAVNGIVELKLKTTTWVVPTTPALDPYKDDATYGSW